MITTKTTDTTDMASLKMPEITKSFHTQLVGSKSKRMETTGNATNKDEDDEITVNNE